MFRAGVIGRVGLNGPFPMVYRQEMYFHIPFLGCLIYSGRFSTRPAEHIRDFKCFFHSTALPSLQVHQ
jgi:hypothetical protein